MSASSGSRRRRAAAIFLSLSTFLVWGRAFLALTAGPLLSADAWFVGQLAGVPVDGNMVAFSAGDRFVVAPGCSSLHGISLALILWTTATQYLDLELDRRLWLFLGAAVLASIGINGVRLSLIALNREAFDYWHTGTGAELFGWLAIFVVSAIIYMAVAKPPPVAARQQADAG